MSSVTELASRLVSRGTVDYDHLLDKVIARNVMLGYMKSYGVPDLISSHPTPNKSYEVTRIPQDCTVLRLATGVKPKVETIAPLGYLVGEGYRIVECTSIPRILVDANDKVFAVIVPAPEDLLREGLNAAFVKALMRAQDDLDFVAINAVSQRFPSLPQDDRNAVLSGIALRGLHKEPRSLVHTRQNEAAIEKLCNSTAVRSIARWQSKCYETWMPKLFALSKDALLTIMRWRPSLSQAGSKSDFASMDFDFSPSAIHSDYPPGSGFLGTAIRAITSGGDYDPRTGGHLALKELKLLLGVPPCATVLLPIAVTYGHVPVKKGEVCVSMTQYTAGDVLAWARGIRVSDRGPSVDFATCTSDCTSELLSSLSELRLAS